VSAGRGAILSARDAAEAAGDRWAPWAVAALTLLALLAGWALRASVLAETRTLGDPASGLTLAVPVAWQARTDPGGALLAARDPQSPATGVWIESRELGDLDASLAQRSYPFELGDTLPAFRLVGAPEEVLLDGDRGVRIDYAYLIDPSAGNVLVQDYPVVIAASATLVARAGRLYIVTTTTDAARLDEPDHQAELERIVASVRLP
jgi:hypothetical protein